MSEENNTTISDDDYEKMILSNSSTGSSTGCGIVTMPKVCMRSRVDDVSILVRKKYKFLSNNKHILSRNVVNYRESIDDAQYAEIIESDIRKKVSIDSSMHYSCNAFSKEDEDFILDKISFNRHFEVRKSARTRYIIDASIDLHGYTESDAFHTVLMFVRYAYYRAWRAVLIITGYGMHHSKQHYISCRDEMGVIRRNIFNWLEADQINGMIDSTATADKCHGGEGAIYVFIRKHEN